MRKIKAFKTIVFSERATKALNVMNFCVSFDDQKLNAPTLPINFAGAYKCYLKNASP